MISDDKLDEIRSRVVLSELIASRGIEVKASGTSRKACCPFHNEKTPSFIINDAKGFYHCFGCDESGDAIKFVMKNDGISFVEAVQRIANEYGINLEEEKRNRNIGNVVEKETKKMGSEMDYKATFIEVLKATNRKGVDNVIAGLEKIGFFEAPASTKHHCAFDGGLCFHSIKVYDQAIRLLQVQEELNPEFVKDITAENIAITALMHDVCKAEIYKKVEKFRKDGEGKWEKYYAYDYDYTAMPLGHGEKSVIRLLRMGLELTNDEILAIRWHMANWSMSDDYETKGNFGAAIDKCPLLSIIIAADELATRISEAGR